MFKMFGIDQLVRVSHACTTSCISCSLLLMCRLQSIAQQRRSVWHTKFSGILQVSFTIHMQMDIEFQQQLVYSNRSHFDTMDPSTPNPYSCSYTPSSNPYCDSPNAPSSPGDLELTNLDNGYYGPHSGGQPNQMGSIPPAPRQKGRPRKRKPKDIEAMTSNLGEF